LNLKSNYYCNFVKMQQILATFVKIYVFFFTLSFIKKWRGVNAPSTVFMRNYITKSAALPTKKYPGDGIS